MINSLIAVLRDFTVYAADGSLDLSATATAVAAALAAEIDATSLRDAEIEAVIDSVYARLGVDVYPTPEVVSIAATTLVGSELTRMSAVSEEIRGFLSRSHRFVGERGRKGGLRRFPKK